MTEPRRSFSNKLTRWRRGVSFPLVLPLVWIVPGIVLSLSRYSVEYDYIQNVRVAASQHLDRLVPLSFGGFGFIPEHQASEILRLMMVKITGLSIEEIQFLPLGTVLVPLIFYVLCRELLNARIAALLSISVAFDPTVVFGSYHTALYAWSRPLLLAFLLLLTRVLKRKSRPFLLLSYFLFVAAFSVYWTGPALMVYFSITVNSLLIAIWWLQKRQGEPRASAGFAPSLSIAFLVTYLGFSGVVYQFLNRIVDNVSGGELASASYSLILRVLQLVGLSPPDPSVYASYGGNSVVNSIQLLRYLLMAIPMIWLIVRGCRRLLATRSLQVGLQTETIILWSLTVMLFAHTFLYASYGHASTRYVALLGPLIGAMALNRVDASDRLKDIFALVVGALAVLSFGIANPQSSQRATWTEVGTASEWYTDRSEMQPITSNVGTYGMISMSVSSRGVGLPEYSCYTPASYRWIIGQVTVDAPPDGPSGFLVLDKKVTTNELCPGFRYFEPLSRHASQMDRNVGLEAIYDNGSIRIYNTRFP